MNNIVPFQAGTLSSVFANAGQAENLAAGVSSGFGVVSIKGKEFAVRYGGETHPVPDAHNPRVTTREIEAVIVMGSEHVSKNWYQKNYAPGDDSPPDCYSLDGIKPEPDSPALQNDACITCKWNRFGSRITDNGKKAKACADNRRLAVVPLADMDNEQYGGPMLLRIPPTSLTELAKLHNGLKQFGHVYFSVAVRIGFANTEYPQLTFTPIRALDDEEAQKVLALRADDRTNRVVYMGSDQEHAQNISTQPAASAPTLAPPSKVLSSVTAQPAAAPVQQAQPAPVQQQATAPTPPTKPGPARTQQARQATVATPAQAQGSVTDVSAADVLGALDNFLSA